MAADETLLQTAVNGQASLRFYGWSRPTLSLGYFQASSTCRDYLRLSELPWVRRPSGGAALVHHLEVTYALGLPAGALWQKRGQSWLKIMHEIIRDALADLGAAARLCGDGEEKKLGEVLCFLHHTPGDLLIGDAKIAGSAQRKQRGALLQHGGILLAASPCTPHLPGLRQLADADVSPTSLCDAVTEHLTRRSGWTLTPAEWSPFEKQGIEKLVRDKYIQSAWNEKR